MILEYILNKFIRLDPESFATLHKLHGKTLAIHCTDFPKLNLYCIVQRDFIQFTSNPPIQIDVTLNGTVTSYLRLLMQEEFDLRAAAIQAHGDLTVAQQIQAYISKLDIDWEEELSKHTGDIIAHKVLSSLQSLRGYQRNASLDFTEMVSEYLQEELKLLPTQAEVEAHYQDIDSLRLAVDRLEAKLNLYANT